MYLVLTSNNKRQIAQIFIQLYSGASRTQLELFGITPRTNHPHAPVFHIQPLGYHRKCAAKVPYL